MCGLSGYNGIKGDATRLMLTIGLGSGIDDRGGHAAGYVSVDDGDFRFAKKCGHWIKARMRFIEGAARGNLCMMHARYATCGSKAATSAHPFAVKRNNKVVLWGAHNGMVPSAYASAKENGREIDVDSQEIFELIADKAYDKLQKLTGYGVITWITADEPNHVKLARLSRNSDFCLTSVKEGGMVWASTWKILDEALEVSGLHGASRYDIDEVGRVYEIHHNEVYLTDETGVKLASYDSYSNYRHNSPTRSYASYGDDDLDEAIANWNGGHVGTSASTSTSTSTSTKKDEAKDKAPDTARGRLYS